MKNPLESPIERNENPQLIQMKELVDFSKKNNISSEELNAAYEMALDSLTEEADIENPVRKEVVALAKKMDDFMRNGLPANRIAELIGTKRTYELSEETYYAMVDNMQINEKGKKVLRSIVDKKRAGTLTIIDPQTLEELNEVVVSKDITSSYSQNDIAAILLIHLAKFRDKKIEIVFSE
ncbi:MAG: hypothetical protein V1804_01085 [Patescibacteria group bacterium]